jgi:hypothetical protein
VLALCLVKSVAVIVDRINCPVSLRLVVVLMMVKIGVISSLTIDNTEM